MVGVREISTGIAHYFGKELQLDSREIDTMRFGLENFFVLLVNFMFLVCVAWGLGILPYVMTIWITIYLLRSISGGAHASTLFRCTIIGTTILTSIGEVAYRFGEEVPSNGLLLLILFSVFVGVYILYKWAPADTPSKPIVSVAKRTRLRFFSYICLISWAIIMSMLIFLSGEKNSIFIVASIGGVWRQLFSITPAGYWFIAAIERLLDKANAIFETKNVV